MTRTIEIAIAVGDGGSIKTCGPNDYNKEDYDTPEDAACNWVSDEGEFPIAAYVAEIELPEPTTKIKAVRVRQT